MKILIIIETKVGFFRIVLNFKLPIYHKVVNLTINDII